MRNVISAKGQAGRSGIAAILSGIIHKLALSWDVTNPVANDISLVSFFLLTQLGMFARNQLWPKFAQWLG